MTPTWFEHATFWSGVRRATVAPRSRYNTMLYKMIAITFKKTILCTGKKSEKKLSFSQKKLVKFSQKWHLLLKLTDDQLIWVKIVIFVKSLPNIWRKGQMFLGFSPLYWRHWPYPVLPGRGVCVRACVCDGIGLSILSSDPPCCMKLPLPGGLVVRIRRSHRRGRGSIPRLGMTF